MQKYVKQKLYDITQCCNFIAFRPQNKQWKPNIHIHFYETLDITIQKVDQYRQVKFPRYDHKRTKDVFSYLEIIVPAPASAVVELGLRGSGMNFKVANAGLTVSIYAKSWLVTVWEDNGPDCYPRMIPNIFLFNKKK